ncbi:hypothetical protein GH733_018401 [Mirounga leonina]|nr:hypothetical protein GH733_018401 [Mirounga leonina]
MSSCYGYFRKLRSWSEAENVKEAAIIAKHITGYQRNQPVWIGLHDPQKRQQWQWIDGAFSGYRSWSGASRRRDEYCVEMSFKDNFLTWKSNDCSKHQHFLCKYQP